jgi:hypothetical protein
MHFERRKGYDNYSLVASQQFQKLIVKNERDGLPVETLVDQLFRLGVVPALVRTSVSTPARYIGMFCHRWGMWRPSAGLSAFLKTNALRTRTLAKSSF